MTQQNVTRSSDFVFLIGHPMETLNGARLPSGRDVMQNFIYYQRSLNYTMNESARLVYEQLIPFWFKSGLPTRRKDHVIKKIKDMYAEHVSIMKNVSRSNQKDQENQRQFTETLDKLFDISHAASQQLIQIEEDQRFLELQRESRSGVIGPVDKKKADRDKRALERQCKINERVEREKQRISFNAETSEEVENTSEGEGEETESAHSGDDEEYILEPVKKRRQHMSDSVLTDKVAATLDRTNTSVRKSTMIMASVINAAGENVKSLPLSKSTVHRHRQHIRQLSASYIKQNFQPTKSVVHWDGKLIPVVANSSHAGLVDRLPVLVTSTVDGSTKLLGVPVLTSGSGRDASDAVAHQLRSWNCDSLVIGMCFDTTASNTGRMNGACQLLEAQIGRDLLWLACRHHMHEILLSDVFTVCFGPSTGPEILFCKRFRDTWDKLATHQPQFEKTPRINVPNSLGTFIMQQLTEKHPRDDYLEFLQLAAYIVGLPIEATVRRPGAIHRARWMAKALYTLKIELLHTGNSKEINLTGRELLGIQRFNRFVILVYLQAWFTCNSAVEAPVNDIKLLENIRQYDDMEIRNVGIKWLTRHSWYLSPELATLSLFSEQLSCSEKQLLVDAMTVTRGPHVLKNLPSNISEISVSSAFFKTTGIDSHFLSVPVDQWCHTPSYNQALEYIKHFPCTNDCAERGVALIDNFNNIARMNHRSNACYKL